VNRADLIHGGEILCHGSSEVLLNDSDSRKFYLADNFDRRYGVTRCLSLAWGFSSFSIVDILEKKSGVPFFHKNRF
jgi:hypothetical protein